ncbi:MAG: hypothetical protein PVSMB4_14990 [Ktedonobacterales bacterium]
MGLMVVTLIVGLSPLTLSIVARPPDPIQCFAIRLTMLALGFCGADAPQR